jgi:hypothetical protein
VQILSLGPASFHIVFLLFRYCETLSLLAVRLVTRDARQALAAAYLAAAQLLPEAQTPAEFLGHLCSWSEVQLDEVIMILRGRVL